MAATSDILLISGLPGAGKTTYTRWLEERGWGCLRVDEVGDVGLQQAIVAADDRALLATAGSHAAGFVVEWGFHVTQIPQLAAMIQRGYNAWYFDGDQQAALVGWRLAHPTWDLETWRRQVDALNLHMAKIRAVYGSRIITALASGPTYLPCEEIHRLLGFA